MLLCLCRHYLSSHSTCCLSFPFLISLYAHCCCAIMFAWHCQHHYLLVCLNFKGSGCSYGAATASCWGSSGTTSDRAAAADDLSPMTTHRLLPRCSLKPASLSWSLKLDNYEEFQRECWELLHLPKPKYSCFLIVFFHYEKTQIGCETC